MSRGTARYGKRLVILTWLMDGLIRKEEHSSISWYIVRKVWFFLKSVDATDSSKTGEYLFRFGLLALKMLFIL